MKQLIAVLVLFGASCLAHADDERWVVTEKGVITDMFGDLQWTQRDNLGDVNWDEAKAYCTGLPLAGGGWRLPTMSELSEVYTAGRDGATTCQAWSCKVSSKFYLTGPLFWSSDRGDTSSEAMIRDLSDGSRRSDDMSESYPRALCVKRLS